MLHARVRRRPTLGSLWILTASLLLALGTFGPATAGDWKGTEENREGVLHVLNPATPIESPTTIELEELWRIGGDSDDEDEFFGVIVRVLLDEAGNSYLLDMQLNEIKVYDPDGEWLRTIGREGEGPGEFRGPSGMFWVPGGNLGVLQTFPPKIVVITPEGEPVGDYPTPTTEEGGFQVLMGAEYAGDQLALLYMVNQPAEGSFTQQNVLVFANSDGEQTAKLHQASSNMDFANAVLSERVWDSFRNRWTASADGRAFVATTYQQYEITVWGADGAIDRVIHREYPDHPRSDEDYARMVKLFEGFTRNIPIPGLKLDIEKNWNQVNRLWCRDDGNLWVQTSRGTADLPEDEMGVFDVYDPQGRFTHQVTLKPGIDRWNDGIFFRGDRVYVVTDLIPSLMALQGGGTAEEDLEDVEPMSVICYRLDETLLGMK